MSKLKNNQRIALFSLLSIGLCSCTRAKQNMEIDAGKYALIDLHLHLDGSISPEAMIKMAEMSDLRLPTTEPKVLGKMLAAPKDCEDLTEYLKCFDLPLQVLQTEETISFSVYDLITRLSRQGLLYAEIRFAPQLHIQRGLTQQKVVEAAISGLNDAMSQTGMKANLILCCMRGQGNEEENLETVGVTKLYLNKGVVACDLAGAEALYPSHSYKDLFQYAKDSGVPFTFHAGEADDSHSVRAGLSFGAKRIGHGIRIFNDETTKKLIHEQGIFLELCPTSNLQTKALNGVKNIKNYPLASFLDSKVTITINTDNMTVSNTTLKKEFEELLKNNVITEKQAEQVVYNAVKASFLTENEKEKLKSLCEKRLHR